MSPEHTRSVTVRATLPEAFSAVREAARRTGFQLVSSDAGAGTALFTSATVALDFGERIHARMEEAAPGAVQVTLASTPALSPMNPSGNRGEGADRIAEMLSGLLPPGA